MPTIERAVVTGSAGFIGRHLADTLIRHGVDVVAIDLQPIDGEGGARVVRADLSEPRVLDDHLTPDTVIFHLAARANVPASVEDPAGDFRNNVVALFEVLESARRARCMLVFPSSAAVYDPSSESPLPETALTRPSSPYGAAKLAGESYCVAYHRTYGLDVRIARLFNVYGPGMRQFVIHDLVRKLERNGDELEILGDGQQIRDYLYVDDAVRAFVAIAEHGEPGQDYNLACGEPTTIMDLARRIARLMGYPGVRIRPTGRSWPGDIPRWYADTAKLKTLGFAPEVDLETGLRRTIGWLRGR